MQWMRRLTARRMRRFDLLAGADSTPCSKTAAPSAAGWIAGLDVSSINQTDWILTF